jgi:hypothetical protein
MIINQKNEKKTNPKRTKNEQKTNKKRAKTNQNEQISAQKQPPQTQSNPNFKAVSASRAIFFWTPSRILR